MAANHLHTGHRLRLKSKFSRVGLKGFEDHEVLEYLLTFAIPQKDVNPLAHELINRFGSLNAVLDAPIKELEKVQGIGNHAASLLSLMPQIAQRYLENPAADKRYSMATAQQRIDYFIPKFVGEKSECLYAALLNNNLEVITCERVTEGSIDAIRLEHRKLIDIAVRHHANSIVLAHNHPSNPDPSMEDIVTTMTIKEALAVCGIHLLDHIVVCRDGGISFSATSRLRHV